MMKADLTNVKILHIMNLRRDRKNSATFYHPHINNEFVNNAHINRRILGCHKLWLET